jgi:hypothetical protein
VIDDRGVMAVDTLDDQRSWKRYSAQAPAG